MNNYRSRLKGIVQRDLTEVKTRLKRSVLINCLVANVFFSPLLRDTTAREVKTSFSVLATVQLNCRVSSPNPAKDGLRTMNLEILLTLADDLTVLYLYRTVISRRKSTWTAESSHCMVRFCAVYSFYGPGPGPYHTVISQPRRDFISQILACSSYLVSRSS